MLSLEIATGSEVPAGPQGHAGAPWPSPASLRGGCPLGRLQRSAPQVPLLGSCTARPGRKVTCLRGEVSQERPGAPGLHLERAGWRAHSAVGWTQYPGPPRGARSQRRVGGRCCGKRSVAEPRDATWDVGGQVPPPGSQRCWGRGRPEPLHGGIRPLAGLRACWGFLPAYCGRGGGWGVSHENPDFQLLGRPARRSRVPSREAAPGAGVLICLTCRPL